MKIILVLLLVLLGIYWLFAHTVPFPLNHEQFGLFEHDLHRVIGVICLVIAGGVWLKKK